MPLTLEWTGVQMDKLVDEALMKQIAETLNEPNIALLREVLAVIGPERAQEFFQKTLEIEAQGGLMLKNGSRRRTPGGVFFYTVRTTIPKSEERLIWPPANKAKEGAAAPPPIQPMPWEEAKQLVLTAIKSVGEAKTVKITLIGRPSKVIQQQNCVVIALKGKEPPSLPKGLPTPPANSAITWAVFIANKQWSKVKESIQGNSADQLIIEGYPLVDPKSSASVVLATSVKSVAQERAQREEKKSSA